MGIEELGQRWEGIRGEVLNGWNIDLKTSDEKETKSQTGDQISRNKWEIPQE